MTRMLPLLRRLPLLLGLILTFLVYLPGLSGGFLFDDYPNIVDNTGLQAKHLDIASLSSAAMSSPSSEFKRPASSLSFALNFLATGMDPYAMKLTNLVIHLVNGWLVFLVARRMLRLTGQGGDDTNVLTAGWIAAAWLLLPINLTAVLYVVQRMESLANAFVLLGLYGYLVGRSRMLAGHRGVLLATGSVLACTIAGVTAKETAVMLPLYALLAEWLLIRHREVAGGISRRPDLRIIVFFLITLILPFIIGTIHFFPPLLDPQNWANRNFTLSTRLLSEARIVLDYIRWTLFPSPHALSFYHDDFVVSQGFFDPLSTFLSILGLILLAAGAWWLRHRRPLIALGVALFFGCQLLTGTVLPLELVYEHRNYFASFGILMAVVPCLTDPVSFASRTLGDPSRRIVLLSLRALLGGLLILWTMQTAMTAQAWKSPLTLSQELAYRGPQSPRAQYELGRTYIIYSKYDPASKFVPVAYEALERSAVLPRSSILPEQALIFMNARMRKPIQEAWWDSMASKLRAWTPSVQDESSLAALVQCVQDERCNLPTGPMKQAFEAAMSHPRPSARLMAIYGDYAWNTLDDRALGERLIRGAVQASPREPAYLLTLGRMQAANGDQAGISMTIHALQRLNIGGMLDGQIRELRKDVESPNDAN